MNAPRGMVVFGAAVWAACAPGLAVPPPAPAAVVAIQTPPLAPPPAKPDHAPDEPFRAQPPAPRPAPPFTPPAPVRKKLGNGVSAVVFTEPSAFCSITVVALGGLTDVPPARADRADVVNTMLGAMLRGTQRYREGAIEEQFARYGMPIPTWQWYRDAVRLSAVAPCDQFAGEVDVLADVVRAPSFEPKTFERLREQFAREYDDNTNDAAKVADEVLDRVLFGSHPYGSFRSARGTRSVTHEEAISVCKRVFHPSRLTVIVAGDVPQPDAFAAVERSFGGPAPYAGVPPSFASAPPAPAGATIAIVDKPGAPTAVIAGGFQGPAAGAPDVNAARIAIQLAMNGGVGRAVRLRDDLKLVPWTDATTSLGERSGSKLGWHTRASTDQLATVLKEVDAILGSMVSAPPTADEVEVMRSWWTSSLLPVFETPSHLTETFAEITSRGLPDDYLSSRAIAVGGLTAEDVRAAAVRYLDHKKMRVVVVGDLASLRGPLTSLGWGPVEVRDATGAIMRARSGAAH